MRIERRKRRWSIFGIIIMLLLVGVGVCFGIQFVTKTGVFRVPGVVKYDESLTDEEKGKLAEIFTEEVDLDKDVEVSADYKLVKPTDESEYIYNIYVPVTDFYSSDNNVDVTEAASLFADAYQSEVAFEMVPFDELDFQHKLLSINDKYYLDGLNEGAVYRVLKFDSEKFEDEIQPLLEGEISMKAPEKSEILTFAQTGVTALARGMNEKLYQVGDAGYFAEKIKDYLAAFDITHTSNESSFSELASAHNICSDVRFIDTLTAIGLDVVELTGNHNVDCGATAAEKTIDLYAEKGIKTVGGGKNAEEAAATLALNDKGTSITMLAYNQSTGGATSGETPGANQYYEANAAAEIKAAKERGDFVIVDVQYYECSAYASEYEDPTCDYANSSAGDQVGFFRHLIDLGADVVVGTSAHQPQTYELYGDGVIYYGLGNLFFDQVWWPGTTRSLILAHYFKDGKLLQTKVVPTVYDKTMQTALMDDPQWYLDRLLKVRP